MLKIFTMVVSFQVWHKLYYFCLSIYFIKKIQGVFKKKNLGNFVK
jgi:hypothetical protein